VRFRPQNSPASPHLARHGYIDKDVLPSGCIAACQNATKSVCSSPQSAEESIEPDAGARSGQGQTQQKATRHPTHRGHVAYGAGEAFPSHRIGRMLVSKKMQAFQEPVTGKDLVVSALAFEECRIVADSQINS
jgi:hypothetical protein